MACACMCFECRLRRLIDEEAEINGVRDQATGMLRIDVGAMTARLATQIGELVACLPDRSQRRRAQKFAHDALDAGLLAARTGTQVPVEVGPHVREH